MLKEFPTNGIKNWIVKFTNDSILCIKAEQFVKLSGDKVVINGAVVKTSHQIKTVVMSGEQIEL